MKANLARLAKVCKGWCLRRVCKRAARLAPAVRDQPGMHAIRAFRVLLVCAATTQGAHAAGRRIKVQHIAPFVGRHAGGLLVTVTGKGLPPPPPSPHALPHATPSHRASRRASAGFLVSTNPKCRFGAMEVVATVQSPSSMTCYTPVNTDFMPLTTYNAQEKVLEVSLNGVDWTLSKRTFTFYDHARVFVSLFEPEGGPMAGGTAIRVHGSSFRFSEHLKCKFTDAAGVGQDEVVDATYIDYHTMACTSPVSSQSGARALEIALDAFHYTGIDRHWTYYDPTGLTVSAVDPIGGPVRGGTLLQIIGTGFAKLGGGSQHGSPALPGDNPDAFRRIDAGTFCKFSIDAARAPRGADPVCAMSQSRFYSAPGDYDGSGYYDDMLKVEAYPREGATALARAASSRHLRNFSCFTPSTTPSLGSLSSIVQATHVSDSLMLCESPPFGGVLKENRALLRVHVTLNGDFHDLIALSNSNTTYAIYDPREARIHNMERTGGPISGETYVLVHGKLFFDFTLRSQPDRDHLLRCRFGHAGDTLATHISETTVACYSPVLYGTGHRQSVGVDITYNGQDYLEGPNPPFVYSPRDSYTIDTPCRDAFGRELGDGSICANNFTGVVVSELQPFGGPALGGTQVVVLGRHFAVQGPSIMCKFGNLSMVSATFLNDTAVTCVSPPNAYVLGTFTDYNLEVTLNGELNFLTSSKVPFAYYDHNATLSVTSIYPQAGPKEGGNVITVYGTGFRVLGGRLKRTCDGVVNGTTSEELYGTQRTEGSMSQAVNKGIGDSRLCEHPLIESTNRGLQCIFGNMPPVHAYLLKLDAASPVEPLADDAVMEDDRVGTAVICELPPLPANPLPYDAARGEHDGDADELLPHVPGQNDRALLPGTPYDVCVEITLNGNRTQATRNCVKLTYYDT